MVKQLFCLLIFFTAFSSCSKNAEPLTFNQPSDTLTRGWSKIKINSGALQDVVFSDSLIGFVSGNETFKTIDGGINWEKLSRYSGKSVSQLAITKDNKIFALAADSLYRSIDFGKSISSTIRENMNDIFFVDNNIGFMIGGPLIIKNTTDGGVNWQKTSIKTDIIPRGNYSTGFFVSPTEGIVTDSKNIFKSNGNLNNWISSQISGIQSNSFITSLFAVSSLSIYAGVNDGSIYYSSNGGINFEVKATLGKTRTMNNNESYLDIQFVSNKTGFACYGSRIYKTIDGGSTWTKVVSLTNSNIIEIDFTDDSHGWGCTDKGEVLKFLL